MCSWRSENSCFFPSAAQAGFVNVPPSSFRSQTDAGNELYIYSNVFCRYVYKATPSGTIYAPAYLAEGAVIKNIRVMCYDNDPTNKVSVSLDRVNMYTNNAEVILDVGSSGACDSIQSLIDSSVSSATPYELRTVKKQPVHTIFMRTLIVMEVMCKYTVLSLSINKALGKDILE